MPIGSAFRSRSPAASSIVVAVGVVQPWAAAVAGAAAVAVEPFTPPSAVVASRVDRDCLRGRLTPERSIRTAAPFVPSSGGSRIA